LHVDASVTLNFKDTPSVFYGRIGVAYRFDMHDQDEYIEEKGKKGRDNKRADKGKKSKKKKKNRKRRDNFVEDEGDGGGLQL
jgi:hypothetical protein